MSMATPFKLPTKKRRDFLERATSRYSGGISQAVTFLTDRYGITKEIAIQWRMGVVESPLPGHEDYVGRLAIPYLTPAGPVAMKFRCIDCDKCVGHKKYLVESGTQDNVFGVMQLQTNSPTIVVCEGEMDAIVTASIVGVPAVGIPGATKWRPHWQYLFEGFNEVVVLRDGDQAGRDMADVVLRAVYNARQVGMPEGEDVASFVVRYGPEALRARAELSAQEQVHRLS